MTPADENNVGVRKLPTGIRGFDAISTGGLPRGRVTLVAGTAGSGKTIFSTQFLYRGIQDGDGPGVYVTFEDSPGDIRTNVASFGWDLASLEEDGSWLFVDAVSNPEEDEVVVGDYDLDGLVARIGRAVERIGATRLALDSVNALFARYEDRRTLRRELSRLVHRLKEMGLTSVMTAERPEAYGPIGRNREDFVADNVVILRNVLANEKRRRTVEVLKMRGTHHQNGEFPFTIDPTEGIVVVPLSDVELTQTSSTVRIPSGNDELDAMLGGGFFRDSVTLVSGATGTGKTLTVLQFLHAGVRSGERCLLFAFEESRDQLVRNAAAWGMNLEEMEAQGRFRVVNLYPHARSIEDHLVQMKKGIRAFEPDRVAVDSLSALERAGSVRSFREFLINLTASVKAAEIAGIFTATATALGGGESVTEEHVSTLTDTILLLRYVESYGTVRRAIAVLKMRGSYHDRRIRELEIDGQGMHVGAPFQGVRGILWGSTVFRGEGGQPSGDGDRTPGTDDPQGRN